jgi:hypothetical protein
MSGIRKSKEEPLFFAVLGIGYKYTPFPPPPAPPRKHSHCSPFPVTSFIIFLLSVWQAEDCLILVRGGGELMPTTAKKIGLLFLLNVVVAYVQPFTNGQSPNFKLLRSPRIDSKESIPPDYVAGYDNHIPIRFLATIDCSKIPAQICTICRFVLFHLDLLCRVPGVRFPQMTLVNVVVVAASGAAVAAATTLSVAHPLSQLRRPVAANGKRNKNFKSAKDAF